MLKYIKIFKGTPTCFDIVIVSLCYSCLCVIYVFLDVATLTEVFPCFFLSCKAMPG